MRLRTRSSYTIGIMAGLCVSLGFVSLLFNIPIGTVQHSGWRMSSGSHERNLLLDRSRQMEAQSFGMPVNEGAISNPTANDITVDTAPAPVDDKPAEALKATARELELKSLAVLDVAELMPNIEGGIGAYYINIDYPQKAINQGIEGRLVLHFVVEPDGGTSGVNIHQSTHPLLDSAAVQALRRTSFIPGHQNGQPVRVRMSLPVSFEIINVPSPDSTNN